MLFKLYNPKLAQTCLPCPCIPSHGNLNKRSDRALPSLLHSWPTQVLPHVALQGTVCPLVWGTVSNKLFFQGNCFRVCRLTTSD